MFLDRLRTGFERVLELIVVLLVLALTGIIIAGFVFRYLGSSLVWYDEVASIGLCWLTYYGSALAALKGAHIGFPGIVNAMPPRLRVAATIFSEACVFLFFGVLTWMGLEVLVILEGSTLVSLPSVSQQLTQSVIPIGGALFIIAEALRLPKVIEAARGTGFADHELEEALEEAKRYEAPAKPVVTSPIGHPPGIHSGVGVVHGGQRP